MLLKYLLVFLSVLLSPALMHSQDVSIKELSRAYWQIIEVERNVTEGHYDEGIGKGRMAKAVFEQLGWQEGIAKLQSSMALCYLQKGQIDSALVYLHDNLQRIKKYEISGLEQAATNYLIGTAYLEALKADTARYYFNNALQALDNYTFSNYSGLPDSLAFEIRKTDQRLILLQGGDNRIKMQLRGLIYQQLGISYMEFMETREAEGYLKLAISDFQAVNNRLLEVGTSINLGMVHLHNAVNSGLSPHLESLREFLESIPSLEASGILSSSQLAALFRMRGYFYYWTKRPELAMPDFEKSCTYLAKADSAETELIFFLPKTILMASTRSEMFRIASEKKGVDKAKLINGLDSLSHVVNTYPNPYQRPWLKLLINFTKNRIGIAYGNVEEWEKAESVFQDVFQWFASGQDLYSAEIETKIGDLSYSNHQIILFDLLVSAASTLENKFKNHPNDARVLKHANKLYALGCQLGEIHRTHFAGKLDKFQGLAGSLVSLNTLVDAFYIGAIRTKLQLDPMDHQHLFDLLELNKAFILRSNINWTQVSLNLPDSVRAREKVIREKGLQLLTTLEAAQFDNDSLKALELVQKIKAHEIKYNENLRSLREQYKKYYDFLYDNSSTDLQQIQSKYLDERSSILEYKIANNNTLFLLCITQDQIAAQAIDLPENFDARLRNFYAVNSSQYAIDEGDNRKIFLEDAHFLYQKLVAPVENLLAGKDHLIIIPNLSLQRLNFDLLLTEPFTEKHENWDAFARRPNYLQLPLLLRKYSVQYGNSVKTLLEQSTIEYKNNTEKIFAAYGGFEPLYEEERLDFINEAFAPSTQDVGLKTKGPGLAVEFHEVERTKKLFPESAVTWLKERATEGNFRTALENFNFNILHISAHGFLANTDPLNSFILMAKSQNKAYDDQMKVSELYGSNVPANLTIISSCNSGNSNFFVDEEGFISVGRGFFYAGCPSVIMGLWQMESETTAEIIYNTCKKIKSKMSYAKALQAAKIDYLNNVDFGPARKAPFYWAALTLWGHNRLLSF